MDVKISSLVPVEIIERRIFLIRGHKVMVDRHLAELYGVTTRALNQAVKRNTERFPDDFMFRFTKAEREGVITICDNLGPLKYSPVLPHAFTENGVAMLSSVLRSKRAILVNIQIMRAFTRLRQLVSTHKELAGKLGDLEKKIKSHDHEIGDIFQAIRELMEPPGRGWKVAGFRPRS